MKDIIAIGLMSGTSLDGLDVAKCKFSYKEGTWSYQCLEGKTFEYSTWWKEQLSQAHQVSALDVKGLDVKLGSLHGKWVNELDLKDVDFIASHGHTVLHQPNRGITLQVGSPYEIALQTHKPVVFDFRSLDVSRGGEGAPLVPIGDKLLFSDFDACLNIGGIANSSYDDRSGKRIAYDICFANMLINRLCTPLRIPFDKDGLIASATPANKDLVCQLTQATKKLQGKSLGIEAFEQQILPIMQRSNLSAEELISSATTYTARCIAQSIAESVSPKAKILCTGGGSLNTELIKRINTELSPHKTTITIPNIQLINFKEAIIFAFLGTLSYYKQPNCLSSVTHASQDSCAGLWINP